MNYVLYGAGGFARELIGWIGRTDTVVYCVTDADTVPWSVLGVPVYPALVDGQEPVLVAIADPASRRAVVERMPPAHASRLCGPAVGLRAVVSAFAAVGRGCIIGPHAVVTGDAVLGEFVLLHASTFVGHGSKISDFCTLSPGARVCGDCDIGEGVFMGTNAVVLPGVRVAAGTKISAGAIVRRDIDAACTVYGDPAAPRPQS